jgi:hypothetical protein
MSQPFVLFCIPTVDEGAEVALGRNIFVTRPDNFDQLRRFPGRILSGLSPTGPYDAVAHRAARSRP